MSDACLDVKYVADLARLELSHEEIPHFQSQLDKVLTHIEQILSIDVDGVEPTSYPTPVYDRVRQDEAQEGFGQEGALKNAPDQTMGQIRVPKVVDAS